MLKIRLRRVGRRHEPTFRVVLTDSRRAPKSGNFIEVLGSYDPRQEDKTQLKGERIKEWMSKGAKLSGTVHNLLVTHKIIEGEKVNVLPRKHPQSSGDTGSSEAKASSDEKSEAKESEDAVSDSQDAPETKVEDENQEVDEEKDKDNVPESADTAEAVK
ncbi:MAG: 30S ribosomal protein S16 [Candidatus Paceibacterota bacterium]